VKGEYVDYIEGDILPFPLELKKLLKQFHSTSSVIPTKKRTVSDMLQQGTHDDSVIISDEPTLLSSSSSSSSSSSFPVAKVMRIELDAARLAENQKLEYFFQNGFSSANYNHEDMCKIGYGIQAMFGIENGLTLYLSVAKKYSSNMDWEDEYTKKFQKHLKPKHDWNMGFFMNLFQRVNKELYQKRNKEYSEKKKQDVLAQREEDILNSGHVHVTDDNDAAEYIFRLLYDKIVYSRGQYYYKNGNIWIHSKPTIDALLMNLILTSELYKYDKERKKETPYGQNVNCAKNIREALFCKTAQAPDDRFYGNFHLTTKGKLAFLDGVLDFQKRMFYTWDEIDFEYYTTQQIKRDFHEYYKSPNREIMELVKNKNLRYGLRRKSQHGSPLFQPSDCWA
jgi:hypothetical protein